MAECVALAVAFEFSEDGVTVASDCAKLVSDFRKGRAESCLDFPSKSLLRRTSKKAWLRAVLTFLRKAC